MGGEKQNNQRFGYVAPDELIARAKNGDMNAHSEIYKLYAHAVMGLACGVCRNREAAEDVVQNTFIKLIQKISLFENRAPFGMWLRSIAVNESLGYLRKHKKHSGTLSTNDIDFLETNHDNSAGVIETSALSAEQTSGFADQLNDQSDLNQLLNELPEHVRLIVWLKEVEGYTHDEIAQVVDKTPSYSKSIVARTFRFLRSKIEIRNQAQTAMM